MANDQDDQEKQDKQENPSKGTEGGPMAMGMAMAKKMMSQMGRGGSPMEMMQKMMAQMGEAGKPPPMDKMMGMCMGMCSEMLNAIRQTNALAVHATPELQHAFADWLKELEGKALAAIGEGEKDATALATALKIGEDSAHYLLTHLAAREAITLTGKAKR
jgi:hypothetical protein